MSEYELHPELCMYHRPLSSEEKCQLEDNIVSLNRVIDPIKVWNDHIIDGKNRLEIAEKHGIEYEVVEMKFDSLDEAKSYVIQDQLGKRNLSPAEMQRLRVDLAKLGADTETIAKKTGVSKRTAQRDQEEARMVSTMPDTLQARIASGSLIAGHSALKRYEALTDEQKSKVHVDLDKNKAMTLKEALPVVRKEIEAEDFRLLDDLPSISDSIREKIAIGKIHSDSESVSKIASLEPQDQELIAAMLESGVDSTSEAIRALGTPKKASLDSKIATLNKKKHKLLGQAVEVYKDLNELKPNQREYMLAAGSLERLQADWK